MCIIYFWWNWITYDKSLWYYKQSSYGRFNFKKSYKYFLLFNVQDFCKEREILEIKVEKERNLYIIKEEDFLLFVKISLILGKIFIPYLAGTEIDFSLCHQYRARPVCMDIWPGSILFADQLQVIILIFLKIIMDSFRMEGGLLYSI